MKLAPLAAVICSIAPAQITPFFQIATTDDAHQMYVWSRLPLKAEAPLGNSVGLYQMTGGNITRVVTAQELLPLGSRSTARVNTHVSGGGQTLIWSEWTRCMGGSACIGFPAEGVWKSFVVQGGSRETLEIPGQVQISRSGRYVLRFGGVETRLEDIETGATWLPPVKPVLIGRALTSGGSVLGLAGPNGNLLVRWSPRQTDTMAELTDTITEAVISDQGRTVVYRERNGGLVLLRNGHRERLGSGEEVSVSNDGEATLFRREQQCFLVSSPGVQIEPLLPEGSGATNCTLAGFGAVALALTDKGQVLRIALSGTRSIEEVVPETPFSFIGGALAPGGILTWRGNVGVRLLLNGMPLPVVRDTPGDMWFQAPFDLQPDGPLQRIEIDSLSPFGDPPRETIVVARAPYFFNENGALVASHQDFRGVVTAQDPGRVGEVVHLWAVSLGAVSPAPKAGESAPGAPLSTLVDPFECRVLQTGEQVPVLFAGLAPGLAGIYQVDVQLPAAAQETDVFVICGTPGNAVQWHGGWLPVR